MSNKLKFSDDLIDLARPYAIATHRSVSKQIEYWARLRKAAEEAPELPLAFIKNTLLAITKTDAGQLKAYKF